jgi:hypothetical protein
MIEHIETTKDLTQIIRLSVDDHHCGCGKIVFTEHSRGVFREIISKDSIMYIDKVKYVKLLLKAIYEAL